MECELEGRNMAPHRSGSARLVPPGEAVVLFDGTCKLCNGWARFIIQHDRAHRIKLATVQSPEGQALLEWAGLPQHEFNTIVLITDHQFHLRSDAMFRIFACLPAPWRWLRVARIIPGPFRDWMYNKIALNRYRLFGQYDFCQLPSPDHRGRFLKHE